MTGVEREVVAAGDHDALAGGEEEVTSQLVLLSHFAALPLREFHVVHPGTVAAAKQTAVITSIEDWGYLIFLPPSGDLGGS